MFMTSRFTALGLGILSSVAVVGGGLLADRGQAPVVSSDMEMRLGAPSLNLSQLRDKLHLHQGVNGRFPLIELSPAALVKSTTEVTAESVKMADRQELPKIQPNS